MARLAVISDVHGNLEALVAVLRQIEDAAPELVVCLGDVVGYGPDPAACLELVCRCCDIVVVGNHDEAALLDDDAPPGFNPAAAFSLQHTRRALPDHLLGKVESWARREAAHGVAFAHGSFGRRRYAYVTNALAATDAFSGLDESVGFVGHTHIPGVFAMAPGRPAVAAHTPLPPELLVRLPTEGKALINPGSVGQPRDRNPDACWGLLDTTERTFRIRRAPYDIGAVQHKIRRAGLPDFLGERLAVGA